jgi:hypothetical protein
MPFEIIKDDCIKPVEMMLIVVGRQTVVVDDRCVKYMTCGLVDVIKMSNMRYLMS